MKDDQTNQSTFAEKALGLISGLFAAPQNPSTRKPRGRKDSHSVSGSVGSRRKVIARTEHSETMYRALTDELMKADVAASNLQVLGLNALREKVGDQWEKHRHIIQAAIESTLSRALTPEDRYWRLDDELYIIAFEDTDIVSTVRRTEAIGAAIVKQLVGGDTGSLVSVQALTGKLSLSENGTIEFNETAEDDESSIAAKRRPPPAKEMVAGKSGEVAFASWAKTLRNEESTKELDALLKEAENVHHQRLETSAIKKTPNVEGIDEALNAAHATREKRSFLDYSLGFAPIWDAKQKAITTYGVLPYFRGQNRWYLEHDVLNDDATPEDIADLDIACLRMAIRETARSFTANSAVLTLSQMHYLTLTSRAGLAEVLRECARVPQFLHKYLSLQVVGMPAELPSRILIDAIAKLRRYFRFIAVRTTPKIPMMQIKSSGFDIATFEQVNAELSPEDELMYQKIMADARALSIPIVVEYVSSKRAAAQLAAMGITYLSGLSISAPLEAPRGLLWRDLAGLPIETFDSDTSNDHGLTSRSAE